MSTIMESLPSLDNNHNQNFTLVPSAQQLAMQQMTGQEQSH